jgi:RNA-directed DNA polymerase
VENAATVGKHAFLPLLHYDKQTKRYRPGEQQTTIKSRPIRFAGHRDSCILSLYADKLNFILERFYQNHALSECIIAYRKLGKANYDFVADVADFAASRMPCAVLCFDITDFFGNLNHQLLKSRLKRFLEVDELSKDWYAVFRSVTRFSWIDLAALRQHPAFRERFKKGDYPLDDRK